MRKYGGLEVYLYAFISLQLDRDERSVPTPGRGIPWTTAPGEQKLADWVGHIVGLDVVKQRIFTVPRE